MQLHIGKLMCMMTMKYGDTASDGDPATASFEKPDAARAELEAQLYHDDKYGQTSRGLKSRHIQLIALGGCIGTGLFVGSGATLSIVGPANLFMAFCFMSFLLWTVMNALAEMTTYLPITGTSVPLYINRFLDPSLAFASGWNYWYAYAMLISAETSAAAVVIGYWTTSVHVAIWITIILILIVCLNIFVVSLYGESEFWFASIKIIAILGLIILGIVLFFGGGPNHEALGFTYWENPGAFKEFAATGNLGRFLAFWTALVRSGFAFILSPELVAIAAGESEAPRRNIPKASSRFVYRLMVFYCLGSLVISFIVSSNDPKLLQAVTSGISNAGASPFVLGIQRAGIPVLNHVVNAVILTSAASAANSFLYAGSRSLYSLAMTSQAPKIFRTCNKQGVPYIAVLSTALLSCLVYLSVSSGSATAFAWFLNITTISGFLAWITLLLAYLRFRQALEHHKLLDTRPYKTFGQPYATYITLVFLILLTLTNGFQIFFPGKFTVSAFLSAYITIPAFLLLYICHKIWFGTSWMLSIEDVDIFSGKAEADALEELDIPPIPRNFLEKVWFWIA